MSSGKAMVAKYEGCGLQTSSLYVRISAKFSSVKQKSVTSKCTRNHKSTRFTQFLSSRRGSTSARYHRPHGNHRFSASLNATPCHVLNFVYLCDSSGTSYFAQTLLKYTKKAKNKEYSINI